MSTLNVKDFRTERTLLIEELAHRVSRQWSDHDGTVVSSSALDAPVTTVSGPDGLTVVEFSFSGGHCDLLIETPLGDAEGYWYPSMGSERGLPADWEGTDRTSLVRSSPLGCLYDKSGAAIIAFGLSRQVRECDLSFGVAEERKTFMVHFAFQGQPSESIRLAIGSGQPVADAIRAVGDWLTAQVGTVKSTTELARVPVYSTWYSFAQDMDAASLLAEATLAARLGCQATIIDDGWQLHGTGRWYAGCGDWVPDPAKFPDLAAHVADLRAVGVAPLLWIAPLLLGQDSDAFTRLSPFATIWSEALRTHILDPRHQEVRDHLVSSCVRLVTDYSLAGLKVDFIDSVAQYQGTPSSGDIDDVGEAVLEALRQLRAALAEAGHADALIEFRQNYIGPATAPYGDLVRARDCPGDPTTNRRSIIDLRLLATSQSVHADPVLWDLRAGPRAAVRQLLNAFFGVPQVSILLRDLDEATNSALEHVLGLWVEVRDVLLDGDLRAGLPSENYPIISSTLDGRQVVGVYQDGVVPIDPRGLRELYLLNATANPRAIVEWLAAPGTIDVEPWCAISGAGDRYSESPVAGTQSLPIPAPGIVKITLRSESSEVVAP